MLPYSLSANTLTVLPLKKIVSAQIVSYSWDASFAPEQFRNYWQIDWEALLRIHRDETVEALHVFIEDNKLPSRFKTILKESILLLYQAYREMLLWRHKYDQDEKVHFLEKGENYAPKYCNVNGEFIDFMWMKSFVNNPNNDILNRFYLACSYWFEEETTELYTELKMLNLIPFDGKLADIREKMDPLITLTIFDIENELHTLLQEEMFEGNFFEVGLKKAVFKGYEYAVYYFLQNLDEERRIELIECGCFFELMSMSELVDYPHDKISLFLFSKLSNEQKQNLLNWTIIHNKPNVWLIMLLSPYSQIISSELLEFIYKLPIEVFSGLLQMISSRFEEYQLPFEMEMFHVLWNKLTAEQKHHTLKIRLILIDLINKYSFYYLGYIIKGLSLEQKENCLFKNWYGTWKCFDILLEEDLELLQDFLTLFLIDFDSLTQKQSLRNDAHLLLQRFTEYYFNFPREEVLLPDKEEQFRNTISTVQTNITLLNELCHTVSTGICTSCCAKLKTSKSVNNLLSCKRKYDED